MTSAAMKKQNYSEPANENPSLTPLADGNSSGAKFYSKRGAWFLTGGLVGGTVIVAVMSFVFKDWSHLTRWLTGLVIAGMVSVYFFVKKWLLRRALRLTEQMIEPVSSQEESDRPA